MLRRLLFSALFALPLFASETKIAVPDVDMTDQNGRHVRAWSDVMKGHTVAVNFVFTSCSTICTPMGATFGKVQSLVGSDVRLVSISIDPANDTPAKMARWGQRFNAGRQWSLLTGSRENVDALRKAFGLYTPDRFNHTPTVVVISADGSRSTRVSGIGPARAIAAAIDDIAKPVQPAKLYFATPQPRNPETFAANYFANLALVDQDGKRVDLYADLMKGHVVVINSFFASCTSVCPAMLGNFQELQKRFAPELGRELHFISISVDPEHDTPEKLRAYAAKMQAKNGWHFLTGPKADVEAALRKIGQPAENPSAHSNLVIVGNVSTGLWKKLFGLAGAGPIGDAVQAALDDKGNS